MNWIRAVLVALILLVPAVTSYAETAPLFGTEQQAQQHCPADTVVWVSAPPTDARH